MRRAVRLIADPRPESAWASQLNEDGGRTVDIDPVYAGTIRDSFFVEQFHWDCDQIRRQPESWLSQQFTIYQEKQMIQNELMEDAREGKTQPERRRRSASREEIESLRLIPGWAEIPEEALRDLLE